MLYSPEMTKAEFTRFSSWSDVLRAARNNEQLYYQAALDIRPRSVLVKKVFKNGKIRIDPMTNQVGDFTADPGHLDRFRTRTIDRQVKDYLRR